MRRRAVATLAAAAAAGVAAAATAGAACAALTPAGNCKALLGAYHKAATDRLGGDGVAGIFDTRGGPLFADDGRRSLVPTSAVDGATVDLARAPDASGAGAAAAAAAPPVAGTDFSDTNVQVEGVAEADLVKTDGSTVYALRGSTLSVIGVQGGGAWGNVSGTLTLDGRAPTEMFLDGDRLLLIGSDFGDVHAAKTGGGGPRVPDLLLRRRPGVTLTVLTLVSVADPAAPAVLATLRAHGRYVAARRVDGLVRLVLSSPAAGRLPWVFPGWVRPRSGGAAGSAATVEAAAAPLTADAARAENKARIAASTLDDWVPQYRLTTAAGASSSGYLVNCNSVFRPAVFAGFSTLSILTFDLRRGGDGYGAAASPLRPVGGVAVQADGDKVYATEDGLYVATTDFQVGWWTGGGGGRVRVAPRAARTNVHRFDLMGGPAYARYVASGSVAGTVLNQFSLHAYDGTLFVATTEGGGFRGAPDAPSSSTVSALRPDGKGVLAVVGTVGDLGVGERIFAVRYIADMAYVVTFKRTDPLYVISLADPTAMVRVGELKIPGFSSYLHPVGPGRLLGVGQDATAEGVATAAKVTLFSVEDPAAPVELDSWVDPAVDGATGTGGRGGVSTSAAAWDHRAFLYWAPTSTAVLPLSAYGKRRFVGAVVLDVGADTLTEVGRVSHPDGSPVERNWVLGGAHLWSLSRATILVNALEGLAQEGFLALRATRARVSPPFWRLPSPVGTAVADGGVAAAAAAVGPDEPLSSGRVPRSDVGGMEGGGGGDAPAETMDAGAAEVTVTPAP